MGLEQNVVLDDDDFMHITCHVERCMAEKIERGEFVDLEKLLVKDKFRRRSEEQRLEFISHDGQTFLAPVSDGEAKITGIRKWEHAFRIYAAIFSKANPHRAAEIWQYVHIINTAASCYIWENVSYYDFTFRQMMSLNPNRSWSKIYNQLWNLSMTTPIQRNNSFGNFNPSGGGGNQNSGARKQGQGKSGFGVPKKHKTCWKFNKNQPCNPSSCDFAHKCSYCGTHGHSMLDCTKLHPEKKGDKGKN